MMKDIIKRKILKYTPNYNKNLEFYKSEIKITQ